MDVFTEAQRYRTWDLHRELCCQISKRVKAVIGRWFTEEHLHMFCFHSNEVLSQADAHLG